jgi:hypothetical protein
MGLTTLKIFMGLPGTVHDGRRHLSSKRLQLLGNRLMVKGKRLGLLRPNLTVENVRERFNSWRGSAHVGQDWKVPVADKGNVFRTAHAQGLLL